MEALRKKGLLAALVVVSVFAIVAVIGLKTWSDQRQESFRNEVIAMLAQRFHRTADAVPGDPNGIELGGRYHDLRSLRASASHLAEPERSEVVYRAFLGDEATVGRAIVNDKPFEGGDVPADTPPAFVSLAPPKRVKVLRLGPDGVAK